MPAFDQVLAELNRYTNYERVKDYRPGTGDLGTDRIERLLALLGNPHRSLQVIHVAGTKGKGSTCMLASRLLTACGHRVGLFVSPHIQSIRERIQISGIPVAEDVFCAAFSRVRPAVETMAAGPDGEAPTLFEILTAMALVTFADAGLTSCILEVGLGGRLDATNISGLPVVVSGICAISRDHEQQLGSSLLSIAAEKAGILRKQTPVVFAPQEEGVRTFLAGRSEALGCPATWIGQEVTVASRAAARHAIPEEPQRIDITTLHGVYPDIALPLMGRHQQTNAAMAFALVELFLTRTGARPPRLPAVRAAWAGAALPARQEIVSRKPWVLLDGAHNPASAWALAETVRERFGGMRGALVFAAASDKDIPLMLRILAPLFSVVVLTQFDSPRCMAPEQVLAAARDGDFPNTQFVIQPDAVKAFADAREAAGAESLVCIAGSLYLAGFLRNQFRPIP